MELRSRGQFDEMHQCLCSESPYSTSRCSVSHLQSVCERNVGAMLAQTGVHRPRLFPEGVHGCVEKRPSVKSGKLGPLSVFSWEFSSSSARLRVALLVVVTGIVTVRVVTEIVRS